MSLQERTLVVKNFDPDKTTDKLLKELCCQGGPVRKVVVKPDHAFVEYEDVESVGYSRAILNGVQLHGRTLSLEPKERRGSRYAKYTKALIDYIEYDKQQKAMGQMQIQMHMQMPIQQPYQHQLPHQHDQQQQYYR